MYFYRFYHALILRLYLKFCVHILFSNFVKTNIKKLYLRVILPKIQSFSDVILDQKRLSSLIKSNFDSESKFLLILSLNAILVNFTSFT